MSQITAVAKCQKYAPTDYGTNINFYPNYGPEENKEWAEATPVFNLTMMVKNEVADRFEHGGDYLITFEKRD